VSVRVWIVKQTKDETTTESGPKIAALCAQLQFNPSKPPQLRAAKTRIRKRNRNCETSQKKKKEEKSWKKECWGKQMPVARNRKVPKMPALGEMLKEMLTVSNENLIL